MADIEKRIATTEDWMIAYYQCDCCGKEMPMVAGDDYWIEERGKYSAKYYCSESCAAIAAGHPWLFDMVEKYGHGNT